MWLWNSTWQLGESDALCSSPLDVFVKAVTVGCFRGFNSYAICKLPSNFKLLKKSICFIGCHGYRTLSYQPARATWICCETWWACTTLTKWPWWKGVQLVIAPFVLLSELYSKVCYIHYYIIMSQCKRCSTHVYITCLPSQLFSICSRKAYKINKLSVLEMLSLSLKVLKIEIVHEYNSMFKNMQYFQFLLNQSK